MSLTSEHHKTMAEALASALKQRNQLLAICKNFDIRGPDDDGLVWLVLHGNGTTGKAMVNLGEYGTVATQVALHLEAERAAAVAAVEKPGAGAGQHPSRLARTIAELEAERAQGWIAWKGGECPVDPATTVQVRFHDGAVCSNVAGAYRWNHEWSGLGGDIVAYRIMGGAQE